MTNGTLAWVGLGSNEGDREQHIRGALDALARTPGVALVRCSQLIETDLVGDGPPQGRFLNGVAELRTTLSPVALHGVMQALEVRAGRRLPAPRNHPRSLDLDLLAYGEVAVDTRDLVVPHPRWAERAFVTGPLADLGIDTSRWPRRARPRLVAAPAEFAALCTDWTRGGCTTGLVPTMGALHAGHVSLIERARAECDRVAVTIFVNPLQFGPTEDFRAYPRTLERDVAMCKAAGADAVFAPDTGAMYDPGFCSTVAVGQAAEGMEGALRPGHFQGVATVVARLFALSRPTVAYFGEKDAQQLAVIRRMNQDLGFPICIVGCPIVREPDGLAMSSRNVYLGADDRVASTALFRGLQRAKQAFRAGERDRDRLLELAREVLRSEPGVGIDYVELRAEADLQPLPAGPVAGGRMLIAARFHRSQRPVRLIDNLSLVEAGTP